jgi:nicotinamide-nucleotide amidase
MNADAAGAPPRWAEIIAVGSELLVPPRLDTNSLFVTERLAEVGIEVRLKTIVGDCRTDLEEVFRHAMARSDVIVLTGGLGPTDDDLTRDAVAAVLDRSLAEDAAVIARIRERFASRGVRMPDVNRRQALVPRGADVLENRLGTAPGLWIEHGGRVVILLPGPPGELRPLFERVVEERLAPRVGADRVFRRVIKVCGRTESELEEAAFPIYVAWQREPRPIQTTVLTAPGQVELHLSMRAPDERVAAARLDAAVREVQAAIGADIFSTDGRAMEEVVGQLLRDRGARIGVAESCTGGLMSSKLTDVPGSSDYVVYNCVCYSNEAKARVLGVPEEMLREHGAVSVPVAIAMADGVRALAGADLGVGVTGIAGPTGGTEHKPVGTVVIAVTTVSSRTACVFRFPFTRVRVKLFAAQMALDLVRRVLLDVEPATAFVWRVAGAERQTGAPGTGE